MKVCWALASLGCVIAHSAGSSPDAPRGGLEARRDLDLNKLAGQAFGSLRAQTLEEKYGDSEGFEDLEHLEKSFLAAKEKMVGAHQVDTWVKFRERYYSDDGEDFRAIIDMLPKGNYAHLHFNAYLPSQWNVKGVRLVSSTLQNMWTGPGQTKSKIQEKLGQDEGSKLSKFNKEIGGFEAMLSGAGDPASNKLHDQFGDLMQFPSKGSPAMTERANDAWVKFNKLTPKFKIPFMYEIVWREYLRDLFRDWHANGIVHGELRHVFLQESIVGADGVERANRMEPRGHRPPGGDPVQGHEYMLGIFHDAIKEAKSTLAGFQGAKIIYCIPRAYAPTEVEAEFDGQGRLKYEKLNDKNELKGINYHGSAEWSVQNYITLSKYQAKMVREGKWEVAPLVAFDVVGREDYTEEWHSDWEYKDQFDTLMRAAARDVEVPGNLALHAGEALDVSEGKPPRQDMDLLKYVAETYPGAKLRGAHLVGLEHANDKSKTDEGKRHWKAMSPRDEAAIGEIHEALARHNVAAELCPVSNENLGTSHGPQDSAGRYTNFIMNSLCTSVSGDNPTYLGLQPGAELGYVAVGDPTITLQRLISLALMSINSSFMTPGELEKAYKTTISKVKGLKREMQKAGVHKIL